MANTQSEPAGRIELVETIAQYLTDAERRSLLDAITALLKSNNAVLLKMQIAPTAGGLSAASDRRMLLTLYDARFHPIATPPTPTKRDAEGTRAAQAIIDDLACRVMEAVRVAWPPYAQPVHPAALSDGTGIAICPAISALDVPDLIAEITRAQHKLVDLIALDRAGTLRRMIVPRTSVQAPGARMH